ncbi:uncharacterized protein LOC123513840 [Portunus trituberculatus]|uniref:uncharacterized protein LOC123513840 n=1 Tax=Portunus trituberculatus TaxID=210409 RepID=UPI001E1D2164|nr:uncharacterized protein LOC123513840 [Portunus trituberculatus]
MTLKAHGTRLPKLGVHGESEWRSSPSPRDLRGASYSHLQDRQRHPNGQRVVLLPLLPKGEEHPMPYYETQDVLLPAVVASNTNFKSQAMAFSHDTRLQHQFVEEILDDALAEEVVATASVVLEESKYKEGYDKHAATLAEEEFIMPEVQRQVYLSVWDLLYDLGRSLSKDKFLEMKKREKQLYLHPVAKQALATHVLEGENWAENMTEEKILSELPWDVLVYNYHKNLQENALIKNPTLQKYLERVVVPVAVDEILEVVLLDALEDDMRQVDQMQKLALPPHQL